MAGIARGRTELSITGPLGQIGPLPLVPSVAVTKWFGPSTIVVANGASEQSVIAIGTQGLTTVRALQITSDKDISVTLGAAGSNAPFSLGAGGVLTLVGTSLTALSITNASGSDASVTLTLAGD